MDGQEYPGLNHGFSKAPPRDHLPFEFQAMTAEAYSADGIKRLEDIGVDEVLVAFRDVYASEPDTKTVEEKIGMMTWYADEVINKSR